MSESKEICCRCEEECDIDDIVRSGKTQLWICPLCQEHEDNRQAQHNQEVADSEHQTQEEP